jgi:hypothetical protein
MLSTKFFPSGRAGFPERLVCSGGRLPVGGQQDAEVVLIGHGGQALQNFGEPSLGIVAVALGSFDHGVDDGGTLAGGDPPRMGGDWNVNGLILRASHSPINPTSCSGPP